jgi:hypothetical protein
MDKNCLFAGKINAVLTREIQNKKTGEWIKVYAGRDYYDLIHYVENNYKINYDYLSVKINESRMYIGQNINVDEVWVKEKLIENIKSININTDYNILMDELLQFTNKNDIRILNEDILIDIVNNIDVDTGNP